MLTNNDIKEELNYAYVHAVAACAGFSCDRPQKDRDSVDAIVQAKGKLVKEAIFTSPKIDLQLKATSTIHPTAEYFSYPLPLKNYNDLRGNSLAPRLLVVLLMPEDPEEWLTVDEEALSVRRCAYWCSLKGAPDTTNETSRTVRIRRDRQFTPETLQQLMIRASCQEEILYEPV